VEELRWLAPVRPGMRLTGTVRVLDVAASTRRPGRGTVTTDSELVAEDGTVVLRMQARGLFGTRAAVPPA